jgi:Zinc knuckle
LNAELGEPWASETLKRFGANPSFFQSLFQELESALVFELAEKETAATSIMYGETGHPSLSNAKFIRNSQERNVVPRNPSSKSSLGKYKDGKRSHRAGNSSCYSCGKDDHWLKDCPHSDKLRSSVISRLQKDSVSSVLFTLIDPLSAGCGPSAAVLKKRG